MTQSPWVKQLDLSTELHFEEFTLHTQFVHVADVVSTPPDAKRATIITFQPVIDKTTWNDETTQWVYILTINNRIVKIGGTRTGLKSRVSSYLCGHHTEDRGKSGRCSVTNAYIYNTLDYVIKDGGIVKMYGFRIPSVTVHVNVWGSSVDVEAQVYNAYESKAITMYIRESGHSPQLSKNSDPVHK